MLTNNGVQCNIINGTGYFTWNSALWMNIEEGVIIYTKYCPFNYCNYAKKLIELNYHPNVQCAFNRAGRLCGSCKKNYSLAIGSSHCIHCPSNNNLALLIFFAAAGFLLVFFISALNLTITPGKINGLIFYANIIWTYQSIFFPPNKTYTVVTVFLKIFIAWMNLDFGIETCFVKGLTAFWKTWLQFFFPFYIWAIAGLMVVTAKRSSWMTKVYGNQAVPLLATLFLLSYMKLLRTAISTFVFSTLSGYPERSKLSVWSVDGDLTYFGVSHTLLLVAALATLLLLWLPYTLSLLMLPQLQSISHLRFFKWITRFTPFYDAHMAPFKPIHRYWFGVLLLARGILLVISASTFAIPQSTSLLILFIFGITILLYMTIVQPYKSTALLILQSSFHMNLILLCGLVLYAHTQAGNKHTLQGVAVGLSTGVAFLQFCGILFNNMIKVYRCWNNKRKHEYNNCNENKDELKVDDELSADYRDSILVESLPLQKH